jgi:hypothetical protein
MVKFKPQDRVVNVLGQKGTVVRIISDGTHGQWQKRGTVLVRYDSRQSGIAYDTALRHLERRSET